MHRYFTTSPSCVSYNCDIRRPKGATRASRPPRLSAQIRRRNSGRHLRHMHLRSLGGNIGIIYRVSRRVASYRLFLFQRMCASKLKVVRPDNLDVVYAPHAFVLGFLD